MRSLLRIPFDLMMISLVGVTLVSGCASASKGKYCDMVEENIEEKGDGNTMPQTETPKNKKINSNSRN